MAKQQDPNSGHPMDPQAGGKAPPDDDPVKGADPAMTLVDEDGDDDPEDDVVDPQADDRAPVIGAGCPNIPSFDYDPKTMKPRLRPGEQVLVTKQLDGPKGKVTMVLTNMGRKVWCCPISVYERIQGPLNPRGLWEKFYPHASAKAERQAGKR